uniref:Uncharacterized protein n=1 Tax=Caenorhabditis japonica TaxID=281687 RepID=A0A8R1J305_CAEJA
MNTPLLLLLSTLVASSFSFEHFPDFPAENDDVIFIDLSDIDHANGAEIPRNLTEEETKIIPTNIDFAALKEAYAKENKAERFLPSRLVFEDKKKRK